MAREHQHLLHKATQTSLEYVSLLCTSILTSTYCGYNPADALTFVCCGEQTDWLAFSPSILHTYRQAYRLPTPSSYTHPHADIIFTSSRVALRSPTSVLARRRLRDLKHRRKAATLVNGHKHHHHSHQPQQQPQQQAERTSERLKAAQTGASENSRVHVSEIDPTSSSSSSSSSVPAPPLPLPQQPPVTRTPAPPRPRPQARRLHSRPQEKEQQECGPAEAQARERDKGRRSSRSRAWR